MSSRSGTSATRIARPSRIIRWQPADAGEETGPGTASTGRFIALAARAVAVVPLRSAASTTSVARPSAAITRLRVRKRCRRTDSPGGLSLTTAPSSAIRASRAVCARGYGTSTPPASTATVGPPALSAPRCAAASMPKAAPDRTVQASDASSAAHIRATSSPYAVQARAPTIDTDLRASRRRSAAPRTQRASGACSPSASSWVGHSRSARVTMRASQRAARSSAPVSPPTASRAARPSPFLSPVRPARIRSTSSTGPMSWSRRPAAASPGSTQCASAMKASRSASPPPGTAPAGPVMPPTRHSRRAGCRPWRCRRDPGGTGRRGRRPTTPSAGRDPAHAG